MTGGEWEREMGVGTGKVHEAGFDLGTPEAQLRQDVLMFFKEFIVKQ